MIENITILIRADLPEPCLNPKIRKGQQSLSPLVALSSLREWPVWNVLLVDAERIRPRAAAGGLPDIYLWHREEDKADKKARAYKHQSLEEKESCRWELYSQVVYELKKQRGYWKMVSENKKHHFTRNHRYKNSLTESRKSSRSSIKNDPSPMKNC
ncbi:MAG: hypothetical protein LBQ54_03260, partial [Planctomycetaceae bacterium]|nr:hypothetical protein [Planctomycetaceae bacterium]